MASNGTRRAPAQKKKTQPPAPTPPNRAKRKRAATAAPKGAKRVAPPALQADKIVGVVRSLKSVGTYPPTVARVLELAEEDAVRAKNVVAKGFANGMLLCAYRQAEKKPGEARVLLAEDVDAVVGTWTLDALESLRKPGTRTGFSLKEVETALPKPTSPTKVFSDALQARGKEARWPQGVGSVRVENKKSSAPLLFLLKDIAPAIAVAASSETTAFAFAPAFELAFDRIDRQQGNHNFVFLRALRDALSEVPRDDFDAGLRALRIARRFTLEGSDGRHAELGADELAAGIRDGGSLLIYASRRSS